MYPQYNNNMMAKKFFKRLFLCGLNGYVQGQQEKCICKAPHMDNTPLGILISQKIFIAKGN
jgi:hypothetical protein